MSKDTSTTVTVVDKEILVRFLFSLPEEKRSEIVVDGVTQIDKMFDELFERCLTHQKDFSSNLSKLRQLEVGFREAFSQRNIATFEKMGNEIGETFYELDSYISCLIAMYSTLNTHKGSLNSLASSGIKIFQISRLRDVLLSTLREFDNTLSSYRNRATNLVGFTAILTGLALSVLAIVIALFSLRGM